ncbi:hypothetical protein MMC29_005160 [Sticta canariensis]|nr:hypothetical protein [Sticta canariensis]
MGGTLQGSNTLDSDRFLFAEDPGSCLPRLPLYLGYSEGCVGTIPAANPSDVNTQTSNSAQPSIQIPRLDSVPKILIINPSSQPGNDLGPPNLNDIHALPGSPEAPSSSLKAPSKPPEVPASSPEPPPNSIGAPSGSTEALPMGKPTQGSQNVPPWSSEAPAIRDAVTGSSYWNMNRYNRNQQEKYDQIRQDAGGQR